MAVTMPTSRCRRSLAREMAKSISETEVSSPAYSHSRSPCRQSPRKRRPSGVLDSPNVKRNKVGASVRYTTDSPPSEKASPDVAVTTKSFYGASKSRYINPLERSSSAERKRVGGGQPNLASKKAAKESVLHGRKPSLAVKKQGRTKRPSVKRPAKNGKPSLKFIAVTTVNKVTTPVKQETAPADLSTPDQKKNTQADSLVNNPSSSTKKFFRNRGSPSKANRARKGPSFTVQKGFNLKFQAKRLCSGRSPIKRPQERKTVKISALGKRSSIEVPTARVPVSDPKVLRRSIKNKTVQAGDGKPTIQEEPAAHEKGIRRDQVTDPEGENTSTKLLNPYSQDLFTDSSKENTPAGSPNCSPKKRQKRHADPSGASEDSAIHSQSSLLASPEDSSSTMESVSLISEASSDGGDSKKLFPIFKSSPSRRSLRSRPSSPSVGSVSSSAPGTPLSAHLTAATGSGSRSSQSSSASLFRKLKKEKDGKEQMILDFGQRLIGAVPCATCGMPYTRGDPSDETTHAKFHHRTLTTLKFPGWKRERVLQENADGSRIISVRSDDKYAAKKVETVKGLVDEELGFVVETHSFRPNSKTFLYISEDKRVVGFCIAESITEGYRVVGDSQPTTESQHSLRQRTQPWCCSTKPEPARCGISRIWVHSTQRRKRIASKILDCIRCNFLMGYPLKPEELAFSDPTPDGRNFATRYSASPCFLVYKH